MSDRFRPKQVYAIRHPESLRVVYIGVAEFPEVRLNQHRKSIKNSELSRWINDVEARIGLVNLRILTKPLVHFLAFNVERNLIQRFFGKDKFLFNKRVYHG